jgi:hypothetical protein
MFFEATISDRRDGAPGAVVSLTVGAATAAFADAEPGAGKAVSVTGIALGGVDAGNYVLTNNAAEAFANITTLTPANVINAATTQTATSAPLVAGPLSLLNAGSAGISLGAVEAGSQAQPPEDAAGAGEPGGPDDDDDDDQEDDEQSDDGDQQQEAAAERAAGSQADSSGVCRAVASGPAETLEQAVAAKFRRLERLLTRRAPAGSAWGLSGVINRQGLDT